MNPARKAWLPPGPAAIAVGRVVHHRRRPVEHRFADPMTQIWIDPDVPDALFDHHPLWSTTRPAPARFRRRDLLDGRDRPLGPTIRHTLTKALGRSFDGPLRTLTQPRVWGWLFNPLTVHLAWDAETAPQPSAVLLEVTNTPWKQRHWYPVSLGPTEGGLEARFDKALHVSPFLDLDWTYVLRLNRRDVSMSGDRTDTTDRPTIIDIGLDVVPKDQPCDDRGSDRGDGHDDGPVLTTRLTARLHPAGQPGARRAMSAALRPDRLPTHRVSVGIHRQAMRLWRKRVPFLPHPDRRP